ncbi:MAG TPA: hypothetical protein VGH80_04330 [Xanthomonadaceae bacterium]|jgi:hypothetical protein
MMRRLHLLSASLASAVLVSTLFASTAFAAPAQDRYAGIWTIASSEPAPWTHDPVDEVPKEIRQLTGAKVTIRVDRIDGPHQVACKHPHYEIRMDGADMLFQGSLEEYGDKNTTPDKAATALGFARRPIATLVTGCANEMEFHAIDDDHLLFGLNNRVYRMTRTQPAPAKGGKP